MSRDDPGRAAAQAQMQAQLDALDGIVAREPVGEEHLELAALVESVQADAPRMDPAFARRLDERIAQRRRRRVRRPALGLHRIALASGGLVAAAVAFAIVISSGILDGGRTPAPAPVARTGAGAEQTPHGGSAISSTRQTQAKRPTAVVGATASFGAVGTAPAPTNASAGSSARLVHRGSSLVLATPARTLSNVAGRVVALTERAGGVVASSYVDAHGTASRASLSLRVPSRRLPSLIAGLSALAQVRSLTQNTTDVTSGYGHVRAALGARRAERAQLSRRLLAAQTTAEQRALKRRIAALSALIARDVREASAYLGEARTASLHVDVVVGATPKSGAAGHHGGGGGTLDRASRTALHALEQLLAIALVALAIMVPVGLCALLLWWGAAGIRQRARERAIRAA